jgi:hypothetical protein
MTASKRQVAGNHYQSLAIQPSEYIHRNGLGWCEGNAVKYITRHKSKAGKQDVLKAIHYLELLIEWEYPDAPRSEPADRVVDVPDVPECGLYRDRPGACASCEEE